MWWFQIENPYLQHGTTIPTIQYEYVRMSLSFRRRGTLCSNQWGEIAWPQSLLWLVTSSIPQSGQKYRFLWSLEQKLAVELWITCLENPQLYCTHITLRPTGWDSNGSLRTEVANSTSQVNWAFMSILNKCLRTHLSISVSFPLADSRLVFATCKLC